jgi:tRNA-specific 2-thiouridylase
VADVIGIEIEHVNFAADYKDRVFAEFLREYQAGRTPNPDVLCNAEIKFKAFLDHAMRLGPKRSPPATMRACARTRHRLFELLKGLDNSKDQSYLHRLNQAQLSKAMFPVGELHKTEVRRIAEEIGLPNAKKKDSTGICFIGERPFRDFLNRYISKEPGPILDDRNRKLGKHVGLSFYTLGQRSGLGIGGVKEKARPRCGDHAPWFVARKEMDKNILRVVQGHDHPLLQSHALLADQVSWVAGHARPGRAYGSKTRYRQPDSPALISQATPAGFRLDFPEAQWAVTPGQSAVLYDGDVCLGGGIIAAGRSALTGLRRRPGGRAGRCTSAGSHKVASSSVAPGSLWICRRVKTLQAGAHAAHAHPQPVLLHAGHVKAHPVVAHPQRAAAVAGAAAVPRAPGWRGCLSTLVSASSTTRVRPRHCRALGRCCQWAGISQSERMSSASNSPVKRWRNRAAPGAGRRRHSV